MGLKSLIKRTTKGSPLTHTEVDDNWQAIEDTFQTPTDSDIGKVPVLNPDKETFSYAVKTDLELGETASTAYRGDRGKTAYDHSQESGNPHGTNKSDIGLGNVDNTSDSNKPISNDMQLALDLKKDKTILSASLPITYTSDKYYGTFTSPLSSSITFDLTGAIAGTKAIVFHNAGTEPTYPVGVIKKGIGIYNANQVNVLIFEYIDSNTILLDVQPASTAGLQPELVTWLSKGGSATGFVLSAMNQFLLDIASIRSKILRFNPVMGESFSSAFIPLIVNADGSNTPLGNTLDLNNNFVSADFKLIGQSGGLLIANGVNKYIDTGFIPNNVAEFGLNDCGFGYMGRISSGSIDILSTNRYNEPPTSSFNSGSGNISVNGSNVGNTQFGAYAPTMAFNFATRNNNAQFDLYCSGVKSTLTSASVSKSISAFKYGVWSSGQSGVAQLMPYVITKGLNTSEEAILRTAITSLQSKLGRI